MIDAPSGYARFALAHERRRQEDEERSEWLTRHFHDPEPGEAALPPHSPPPRHGMCTGGGCARPAVYGRVGLCEPCYRARRRGGMSEKQHRAAKQAKGGTMTRTRWAHRVDGEDLEMFVTLAVRHTLGSAVHSSAIICEAISKLELSVDTCGLLVRLIDKAEGAGRLGPEPDAWHWRSLRDRLRGKGPSAGRGEW